MMKFTLAWLKEHLETDRSLGEIRPVAEREGTQTLIFLRDCNHVLSPPASVGTSSGLKP